MIPVAENAVITDTRDEADQDQAEEMKQDAVIAVTRC